MPDNEAKTGGTYYINFYDAIDTQRVHLIMKITSQIVAQRKPDCIYFNISSGGGEVRAGITLFNYLVSLPCKIVMHNIGSMDSVATVVFLAGDERYAAEGTSFLFHGVKLSVRGSVDFSRAMLAETLSQVTEDENKIAAIIASRCDLTVGGMMKLFDRGEAKDLNFALDKGIINAIREASIPGDAEFITLHLQVQNKA